MMALCEIWILSENGGPIMFKKYRNEVHIHCDKEFQQILSQSAKEMLKPHNVVKGVNFFHIKRQGVYFLAVSCDEMNNVYVIELLSRLYQLCKDFCGSVSENSIRKNFILIHEILDEIMNYGLLQLCTTDKIKPHIQSTPIVIKTPDSITPGLFGVEHKISPGNASNKSVIKSRADQVERKDEIFIDIIEHMAVVIDSKGIAQRCEVQGTVNMKTFLKTSAKVRLTFNESLIMGQQQVKSYGNQIYLEDYKFHNCVDIENLNTSKVISVQPPEGEFAVMTYKAQGDLVHGLPIRVYFYVNNNNSGSDLELGLKLRCEIPSSSHAVNVKLDVPLPKSVISISQQLGGPEQSASFMRNNHSLQWNIKKIPGKTEMSAHFKLIEGNKNPETSLLELGPAQMDFEISGFLCSNLQIKHLKVEDRDRTYVPERWVRYITTPDSYTIKLH